MAREAHYLPASPPRTHPSPPSGPWRYFFRRGHKRRRCDQPIKPARKSVKTELIKTPTATPSRRGWRSRWACRPICAPLRSCRSAIRWAASGRCAGYRLPKSSTRISGVSLTAITRGVRTPCRHHSYPHLIRTMSRRATLPATRSLTGPRTCIDTIDDSATMSGCRITVWS